MGGCGRERDSFGETMEKDKNKAGRFSLPPPSCFSALPTSIFADVAVDRESREASCDNNRELSR